MGQDWAGCQREDFGSFRRRFQEEQEEREEQDDWGRILGGEGGCHLWTDDIFRKEDEEEEDRRGGLLRLKSGGGRWGGVWPRSKDWMDFLSSTFEEEEDFVQEEEDWVSRICSSYACKTRRIDAGIVYGQRGISRMLGWGLYWWGWWMQDEDWVRMSQGLRMSPGWGMCYGWLCLLDGGWG